MDGIFLFGLDSTQLQYNTKDSSVRLAYEAQPRPKAVSSLSGETIVKVACGTNHTGFPSYLFTVSPLLFLFL